MKFDCFYGGPCYDKGLAPPPQPLVQMRVRLRVKHYSIRNETQYLHCARRFILFHKERHPREMGAREIEAYLTHLAVEGNVAAATQNQALSAVLFLYREVLGLELPWMAKIIRARRPKHLSKVLTRTEVQRMLGEMHGIYSLLARLLCGPGMRLTVCD